MGENINKQVMEMVQKGHTHKEIMAALGVSKRQISRIIKEENPELYEIIKNPKKLQEFRNKQSDL